MNRLTRLLYCATLLCAALMAPARAAGEAAADPLVAWAQVLNRFVNDRGEVDFEALSRDRAQLDSYVRHVGQTPIDSLPEGNVRIAHMINAYNALSMFNVLESGIPATHAGFNKVNFFILRRLEIGGQTMSLRAYENEIIRPYTRQRNDPRIHFALNCSALSCPVLPRTPFSGATLDAELERETKSFFARSENFRIDAVTNTLWLSELLDFYPEDFVPRPAASLLEYANGYAPQAAPADFKVRFVPYDWTIANSRRAR